MLKVPNRSLSRDSLEVLNTLQARIESLQSFPEKVQEAARLWKNRLSTQSQRAAFSEVKAKLAVMCYGTVRCGYCEDSLADEVEHILPKSVFPQVCFDWANYLFVCGPCNRPKSNRYGFICAERLSEFRVDPDNPIPPPIAEHALINPRDDDPFDFIELDLGGRTPTGEYVEATFDFVARDDLPTVAFQRANFTIDVLGLNREVLRVARQSAFDGFKARLVEMASRYSTLTPAQASQAWTSLLASPHLSVFAEMRRQKEFLPEISSLFDAVPDLYYWPLAT